MKPLLTLEALGVSALAVISVLAVLAGRELQYATRLSHLLH
jgi:hypothetical protein